jgi:tetraacyldisaccharide 4'-kinase
VFGVAARYHEPRLIEPFGAPLPAGTGRRVVAVAGIARPARFFAALRTAGWDVARELVFRDHHWFTPADVESMQRAAVETKADLIVTTEKDAMRLRGVTSAFAYLPMELAIEPAAPFAEWLSRRLRAA